MSALITRHGDRTAASVTVAAAALTSCAALRLGWTLYRDYGSNHNNNNKNNTTTSTEKQSTEYIASPIQTQIPHLSSSQIVSLPYPPTGALPGARDVPTAYGSIRVYEWGPETGEKVLFVHGISTPCIALGDLGWELVGRGYRVMLFDLFGRGYSDAPQNVPYDVRLYTTQILLVLASSRLSWLGTPSPASSSSSSSSFQNSTTSGSSSSIRKDPPGFHLLGYSLGGCLCVSFATQFPHLLRSLDLVATSGLIRRHHIGRSSRLLYESGLLPEWVVQRLVRRRIRPSSPAPRTTEGDASMMPGAKRPVCDEEGERHGEIAGEGNAAGGARDGLKALVMGEAGPSAAGRGGRSRTQDAAAAAAAVGDVTQGSVSGVADLLMAEGAVVTTAESPASSNPAARQLPITTTTTGNVTQESQQRSSDDTTRPRNANSDATGGAAFDSASLSRHWRPEVTVSSVVQWQVDQHAGFVGAFLSTIRECPIYSPRGDEDWRALRGILLGQRRGAGYAGGASGGDNKSDMRNWGAAAAEQEVSHGNEGARRYWDEEEEEKKSDKLSLSGLAAKGKILVILGGKDSVIDRDETVEDITAILGGGDDSDGVDTGDADGSACRLVDFVVLEHAGHEVPITASTEVADALAQHWRG
ncbi:Alpha/Beta hydrolase protein [Microdochium trichocladiopsis]|uniref:Alpha/Beta hydrolase protein n=1 Tax=Microdochium trichocladiopsis TaxID=1682393 RepID=A0A9P8Y1A1_9PEZI|nr:Alpha/Beta hydrolase protein [Microdochium trichocladiopsis]KAH7027330.1 Alpha/Beta hydrolase protein [Microdochium trichocladiopsis]